MNKRLTFTLWPLTLAALAPFVAGALPSLSQDGLVKVRRGLGSEAPDVFDRALWRAALTEPDLDLREQKYGKLLRQAPRSSAAREALHAWARDTASPELAWTSRLALRELDRAGNALGRRRSLGGVFEGADPFAFPSFLDDLERRLEDVRAYGLQKQSGGVQVPPGWSLSQAESFRMESGPDGVRIEIKADEKGEEITQTFEADSLEDLLAAHPELEERMGAVQVPGLSIGPDWLAELDGALGRVREQTGHSAPNPGGIDPQSVRTDVLGVLLREPGEWSASLEGIEPGVGLLVERIFRDTIAYVLGVRRGDVLLELNGIALRSADDLRRALAERPADADVKLVLIDRRGERRECVWKPSAER